MSRRRQKNRLPPFVPMLWDMLNHKAYHDLAPSAAKALPYFLGKIKRNGPDRYEEEFSFSYREAKKYGFASSTWSKVIQEVVKHGFVDPIDRGGLRGEGRSCSKYSLSTRWKEYGTEKFREINWRCFLPRQGSRVAPD